MSRNAHNQNFIEAEKAARFDLKNCAYRLSAARR